MNSVLNPFCHAKVTVLSGFKKHVKTRFFPPCLTIRSRLWTAADQSIERLRVGVSSRLSRRRIKIRKYCMRLLLQYI